MEPLLLVYKREVIKPRDLRPSHKEGHGHGAGGPLQYSLVPLMFPEGQDQREGRTTKSKEQKNWVRIPKL